MQFTILGPSPERSEKKAGPAAGFVVGLLEFSILFFLVRVARNHATSLHRENENRKKSRSTDNRQPPLPPPIERIDPDFQHHLPHILQNRKNGRLGHDHGPD